MNKRLSVLVIVVVLAVISLVASFISPATAQTTPDSMQGELRFINGLVGLGPVDVYLNEDRIAYNLSPEAATTYFSIPAGRETITVRATDADPFSVPIADMLVDIIPDQSVTAIAYQKQFATDGYIPPYQQSSAIYTMIDDRSPIQMGKTRLTAVHLALGAPDSITVGYPRAALLASIGLEQPFGSVDTQAGLYSLTLVDSKSANQSVLDRFGDESFYGNTLYTLVMVPNMTYSLSDRDGTPIMKAATTQPHLFIVSAPVKPPMGGMRLRLVNTAYSIQAIDVYLDGSLLAARMNYGTISEYLALPGFQHVVTLRRAGSPADALPLSQTSFAVPLDSQPQQDWTLLLVNGNVVNDAALQQAQGADKSLPVVANSPSSAIIMTLLPDNLSKTADHQARLRLLHAVDNLPPISLFSPNTVLYDPLPGVVATATLMPTLSPLQNTQPLVSLVYESLFAAPAGETEVRTGIYDELNLLLKGNGSDIQTLPTTHFVQGLVYTYVVMGSPSGNPPIQVIPLTDFGHGSPFFRPGQLPTPTAAPVVVTRIPQTPTPGGATPDGSVVFPTPTLGAQASGNNGGGSSGNTGGGGGDTSHPTKPPVIVRATAVPPTSVPPTAVPPTSVPPTAVPPTDVPPPQPTNPPPQPTDPPAPQPQPTNPPAPQPQPTNPPAPPPADTPSG
ncbi:MAG: DUF4397 domain-containing protein [Chloroflexota bacterium]